MISSKNIQKIVKEYLFSTFPYEPSRTIISPIDKPADLPGQWVRDSRPMFWVKDDLGKLLAVVKVISVSDYEPWKFANLEKSIEIFNQLHLKRSQTISILSGKRISRADGAFDLCIMSPAYGRGLHELFVDTDCRKAIETLYNTIRDWAKVLAELHLAKATETLSLSKIEKDKNLQLINRFSKLMKKDPHLFPFKIDVYLETIKYLQESAEQGAIFAGITHGDPDPTNVIYNDSNNLWTLVDIDNLALSVDSESNPITSIGNEFIQAKLLLMKVGFFLGFSQIVLDEIEIHFQKQYQESMGRYYPTEEQVDYFSALYFSRKITWITALEEGLKSTLNFIPDHFGTPRKYREKLIRSLGHYCERR